MNQLNLIKINLIHVLLVAPLLMYLGNSMLPTNFKRTLIGVGVLIALYHGYKYLNDKEMIRLVHILVIAPLLILRGTLDKNMYVDMALIGAGASAMVYHSWLMWKKLRN